MRHPQLSTGMESLVESYISTHAAGKQYQQHLRRAVRRLAGVGISECRQLSSSSVTRFLESIQGSSSTVAGYRRIVLSLWRHAVQRDLAVGPVEARPVRVRIPPVRAWSAGQLTTLVNRAASEEGFFRRSRCPKSRYWLAFCLLGYETGIRLGDLHELRLDNFEEDYSLLVCSASKTGEPIIRPLSDRCRDAVRDLALVSRGGLLFSWALSRRHTKAGFTRLCRSCGLPGSVRWLRRSGATACEAASPGSASRFLAHRSPGVAARHYVDWSKVSSQPVPPPIH
jgi:integrase